jgi:hypothetical protein
MIESLDLLAQELDQLAQELDQRPKAFNPVSRFVENGQCDTLVNAIGQGENARHIQG